MSAVAQRAHDSRAAAAIDMAALRVTIAGRVLIDGLTLSIASGELWALLGANGAGKTMLLHTLAGLHRRAAGSIAMFGKPLDEWSIEEAAQSRGFLPQSIHDTFGLTVLELALMGRHPHLSRWRWEGDDDHERALGCLDRVDMAPLAARDVTELSGGERQRAAIATLLVQDAPLMLLDEPVAHLDLPHQMSVLRHLRALADGGHAIVFSIHDLNLARRFATHALVVMGDGTIRSGTVAEVMGAATLSAAFDYPVAVVTTGAMTMYVAG